MTRLRTISLRLFGLFLALLALAGPAMAGVTSGTIKGQVIDDGGLAIPGVLVTLSSPNLIGGGQQRTSDEEGNFLFVELPPGVYDLLAQKQGFGAVRKTNLDVALGRTLQITVEMKVGREEVTIEEAKPSVDTESASKGQTFSKEFLSRIPSGRSYQDVVGNTAGVVGGGNPSSGGASTNENTFMLDGVNVTDPVTGTFSTNFNFDAIEEIEVITGGFDPEYGQSLGAVVSVVTKSGGNQLEVVTNGNYSNGEWAPKMDARYATDGLQLAPTGFDERNESIQVGSVVSGPIMKDRIWFLAAYEYNRGLYSNAGVQLPWDFDGHSFFGKITGQPSSAHRITAQLSADAATIDNTDQSARVAPEAQGRQAQASMLGSLKWNWFINPETNLETQASYQKQQFVISSVPCTHDLTTGYNPCGYDTVENTIDFTTPGRVGADGAAYTQDNYGLYQFDRRNRIEGSSKFSLLQVDFFGKHDLKAGVEGSWMSWDWVVGYNGNLLFYDILENNFDPASTTNYYWLETTGPYQYKSTGLHAAAFLQDVYKPIQNLTFRYGVRYDRAVLRNDGGEPIVDLGVFGPRVYAVWDPFATEKTKLYGGYGRFNDTGRLEIANYLSQSNLGYKMVLGEYFQDNQGSDAYYVYADYDQDNTFAIFDNTIAPHSDEFTLGAEREVIPEIVARVEFTGKFTKNVYTFDETNLIYDEDGYAYLGSSYGNLDPYYRLRTPTIALRDYFRTDFVVFRDWADRWLLYAVYSYTVSKGRTQNSLGGNLANPGQVDLMYGNLGSDIRHQVKLQAAWDIPDDPWTTTLGGSFEFLSGQPISRYYFSSGGEVSGSGYDLLKEPLGTYGRENAYWSASVLIEQDIPVRKGKLAATAQVENITNNQFASTYYGYYVNHENRYVIAYRQTPVTAMVGAKYEF